MLHSLLLIVHFFCALGIVALVLLQRGKGADAGAGFGAGASGTVFGARGATTALSRATAVLAGIFMITSLSLAYVGSRTSPSSNSLLDRLAQPGSPAVPASLPPNAPPRAATPATTTPAPVTSAPATSAPVTQAPVSAPPAATTPSTATPAAGGAATPSTQRANSAGSATH